MKNKELLMAFVKYDADKNADWRIPIEENTVDDFLKSIKEPEETVKEKSERICPYCESDNIFSIELKHSKCKDCEEKWTD